MKRYDPIIEQKMIDGVSGANLMDTVRILSQWERTSGSLDETLSFRWIERRLQEFGFRTDLTFHEAYISIPVSARLTVENDGSEIECIAHAFTPSTPEDGTAGKLVFVESPARASAAEIAGKIVLTTGTASGPSTLAFERAGAIAQIYIHDAKMHETSVSPTWGNPTPETADGYPTTPGIAIRRPDGSRLRAMLDEGPVRVRMTTEVDTAWRLIPLLVATLPGIDAEDYLLLSCHVDSWYFGAMDNAAANATIIETGRQMKNYRRWMRRGLKLAFWSGHSHGRFAGSAWYVDTHWQDLRARCVGHVNCDSSGGIDATVLDQVPAMAETRGVAAEAVKLVNGIDLKYHRVGRGGDQSFYGVGLPCTLGTPSVHAPDPEANWVGLSAVLGWWWHTPEDTIDKVDEASLVRDTKVYVSTVYRLLSEKILPYDERPAVEELRRTVDELDAAAGEHFDLSPLAEALARLEDQVNGLYAGLDVETLDDDLVNAANQTVMELAHHLIPINYHEVGPFDHDPAGPMAPLPSLQPVRRLPQLTKNSDEYYLLLTRLRRSCNWVMSEVKAATDVAETAGLLFSESAVA
jgi:hypothetical protein